MLISGCSPNGGHGFSGSGTHAGSGSDSYPLNSYIASFWTQYPALAFGLAALSGCWAGLCWHWSLLLPISCLILSAHRKQAFNLAVIMVCVGICCWTRFDIPDLPEAGIPGTALISISKISDSESFMGSGWILKGELLRFEGSYCVRRGRVQISFPGSWKKPRPDIGLKYIVRGQLRSLSHGSYAFKVSKHTPWLPAGTNFTLAEWRYRAKKSVSNYLQTSFQNPKVAAFLTGLTTGEYSDKQTQNALAHLGVQHLLAISGFHFALFATFLGLIARALIPRRIACLLLMSGLAAYFIFLGYGASIGRAWLMIALALLAEVSENAYKGLNILGVALLALLIWDPLVALDPGFQLSFLASGAILLLYPAIDTALSDLLPKRSLSSLAEMSRWDQQGYIVLCMFRQALALVLAVQVAVIPLCLYLFGSYPLIGVLANLFYPFLAGLSLTWLTLSIPLQLLIPPLGRWMHSINNGFTESLLGLAYTLPPRLQLPLQVDSIEGWVVVAYLTALLGVGIVFHKPERDGRDIRVVRDDRDDRKSTDREFLLVRKG